MYDIFYRDGTMDRDTSLPRRAERGAVALNTDWDGHCYVEQHGQWVEARYQGGDSVLNSYVPKSHAPMRRSY